TFDAAEALADQAFKLHPGGNILNTYQIAQGDLEAAFAGSDILVESQYDTAFQEHSALERETTLGYIDERGRVTVVGGTHEPHWQQDYIAQALGIPPAEVCVIVPPTGGSFGGRQDPWPLVAVGLLAYVTRRPVRLAYSRREVFEATTKRHPYHVWLKIGAGADGRLIGLHAHITANTGAYDSSGYWIPGYAVTAIGGAYRWQAAHAYAQAVYTNGPKCGQFRGYGSPQSVFAMECALDELAEKLGLDPLELRRKNLISQNEPCFLGYPVGESLAYEEVLEAVDPAYRALLEDARAFNNHRQNRTKRMGVGFAGMWYRFGKPGRLAVETHAELAADGRFVIYCSAPDYGQGIGTVMVQLAAEGLGVSRDRVGLVNADTARTPDSGVQGASRAVYFIGASVQNAVHNLKQPIFATAAELLDEHPANLILQDDRVAVQTQAERFVTLSTLAYEFDQLNQPRRIAGYFDLSSQFPPETRPEYLPLFVTGAQAALVAVDMQTGQVEVKKIAAVHDVGRAINPLDAEGQICGAMLMGVGAALSEEYLPGVTTGFSDYILPMINTMPEMEVKLVEVPSYYGPLGAKGLGEAAILPTAPAVLNAISRAIGVRLRRLPATPERVLAAIRSG
ncbi:MAG TPA: molybdopterin cofactor-binding domain-containing protein, partial [Anaerolineales bacterium]|nr:molybdopterin cofactor-binding domain-containing protein [Anaerolineales bacterium]